MREYLVELRGTYNIPKGLKDEISGLDLAVLNYKINEKNDILITYLSFLIDSEDKDSIIGSEGFYKKIVRGLWSNGKDFERTPENEYKYIIYKDIILKHLKRENLEIEIISIRPTGRIKKDTGFEYNGKVVNYKDFTNNQKGFLTLYLTRILTSKDLEELANYYERSISKIESIGKGNSGFIQSAREYISYFYRQQQRYLEPI
jgi:hypothetical protein